MTNKRKYLGGNLLEYVIPIALVGLVAGAALFNLTSGRTMIHFIEKTVTGGHVDERGNLKFGVDVGVETTGQLASQPATVPSNGPVSISVRSPNNDPVVTAAANNANSGNSPVITTADSYSPMTLANNLQTTKAPSTTVDIPTNTIASANTGATGSGLLKSVASKNGAVMLNEPVVNVSSAKSLKSVSSVTLKSASVSSVQKVAKSKTTLSSTSSKTTTVASRKAASITSAMKLASIPVKSYGGPVANAPVKSLSLASKSAYSSSYTSSATLQGVSLGIVSAF